MNIKILENIGLSSLEAKIYLSLLETGSQNISDIAKSTQSNRVQVYAHIPRLLEARIIGETIKGKRKYFFAENPENLENIFYEQKLSFENTISALKEKYKKDLSKPELKVFYTHEATKHIFFDVIQSLKQGECYYRYSSRKHDTLRGFLPESYKKLRDEKEIQRLVITSEELKKQKEHHNRKLNREMVSIPKNFDLFDDNISKIIYAHKIAIIDYESGTSYIIENRKLANFEKKLFLLLYKSLKKQDLK